MSIVAVDLTKDVAQTVRQFLDSRVRPFAVVPQHRPRRPHCVALERLARLAAAMRPELRGEFLAVGPVSRLMLGRQSLLCRTGDVATERNALLQHVVVGVLVPPLVRAHDDALGNPPQRLANVVRLAVAVLIVARIGDVSRDPQPPWMLRQHPTALLEFLAQFVGKFRVVGVRVRQRVQNSCHQPCENAAVVLVVADVRFDGFSDALALHPDRLEQLGGDVVQRVFRVHRHATSVGMQFDGVAVSALADPYTPSVAARRDDVQYRIATRPALVRPVTQGMSEPQSVRRVDDVALDFLTFRPVVRPARRPLEDVRLTLVDSVVFRRVFLCPPRRVRRPRRHQTIPLYRRRVRRRSLPAARRRRRHRTPLIVDREPSLTRPLPYFAALSRLQEIGGVQRNDRRPALATAEDESVERHRHAVERRVVRVLLAQSALDVGERDVRRVLRERVGAFAGVGNRLVQVAKRLGVLGDGDVHHVVINARLAGKIRRLAQTYGDRPEVFHSVANAAVVVAVQTVLRRQMHVGFATVRRQVGVRDLPPQRQNPPRDAVWKVELRRGELVRPVALQQRTRLTQPTPRPCELLPRILYPAHVARRDRVFRDLLVIAMNQRADRFLRHVIVIARRVECVKHPENQV